MIAAFRHEIKASLQRVMPAALPVFCGLLLTAVIPLVAVALNCFLALGMLLCTHKNTNQVKRMH